MLLTRLIICDCPAAEKIVHIDRLAQEWDCFVCSVFGRNRRDCPAVPPAIVQTSPTIMDLITSLASDELRSVMTSCLNHVSVLLPAGSNPVMTGSEWGYPELKHDTISCMKLVLEEIAWALEGFFGEGGSTASPADVTTSP